MKNLRNFALAAFALLGFAACQQEEFAPEIKNPTHSVTFVAGAPETKTTVDISDEKTAKFAWTKDDEGRIAIYENGVAATTVVCGLDDKTGKMTIMAEFKGTATGNETYVAVVNKSNDGQIMTSAAYDEDADILVSKAVSTFDGENGVLLQFKREVAIAKMTLKGLDPGEVVNHVTVSSTADIAGKYGVDGWASPAKSLEISSASYMGETDGYSIVSNASGEAVVWFTCIPQDAATLTVKVKAADGDTYTKEFSKEITLTRGDVKAFGVKMTKDTPKTYGYQKISSVEDYAPGDYIIVAHAYKNDCPTKGDFAIANNLTLSSDKLEGNDVTTLIDNDVISESDGASYKLSLSGDKDNIVISNGTKTLAYKSSTDLVLGGDNKYWTLSLNTGNGGTFKLINNSTANASTIRALSFQSYTTNKTVKTASLKFGPFSVANINNADYTAIELYKYQEVSPSTPKYSISFAEVTGGTLSASPIKAEAGAEVTLTATPDAEYTFNNDWTVTNAESSEAITVTNSKFTMPAANVTVSATFTQKTYAITANTAENGTYTVKVGDAEVTSAVKGAKVVLEATPAEGYICDGWTVLDAEGNSVTESNNSFYMPASAVTISTSFSLKPVITYDHAGTAGDPYSVADVLKFISTLGTAASTNDVYAKGVITSISEVSTSYGNATYNIKDEDVENEVLVFRGLYLNGANFTSADQIAVGDEVVVKGKVKNYNGTPQFNSGNSIVSIVKAPYLNVTASKETGISAAGETVTITVDTNVDSWTATSDNGAFVVGTPSGNTVDVVVSKNTDATERTATITVTAGTLSETITLTQKAAGAPDDVIETINFESVSTDYSFWTFTNMTSQQTGSIKANGGTYYGTTGGKTTASITTKSEIASPKSITFYVSKESKNTTSSSWILQVSSDNKTWTEVKTQSAATMSKGSWVKVTQDLSSYSNVYVRVYYTGSTAVRNIDDLSLTYSN